MLRIAPYVALIVLLAMFAPAASAGTPTQDLAWINAKRAINGIPSNITLNPDWSAKCAQHVAYMRATNTVTHAEDPNDPHFSVGGNWAAAHALLASTTPWTENNFIWETAPLHLSQLLAPQLSEVGIADDGQFVCVTTWPGYRRPPPANDSIVTYPGNGTSIYSHLTTNEWPTTPAAALGLNPTTGPRLYVYEWGSATVSNITSDGLPLRIKSVTLRGPGGVVPVKWVDGTNQTVGQYLPLASGIIVPVVPLQDNAQYTATVAFTNGLRYSWGFNTDINPKALALTQAKFVPGRTGITRTCQVRLRGICTQWHRVYATTLRISGRFVDSDTDTDTDVGNQLVGITFRFKQRAQVRTQTDGSFATKYRFSTDRRQFDLVVEIMAGDYHGAFLVHFKINNNGTKVTTFIGAHVH